MTRRQLRKRRQKKTKLTGGKIGNRDFVTVPFLRWDGGGSEEFLDSRGRDHDVFVLRQLFVPLPDRDDDLGERPAQGNPPNAKERVVRMGRELVLYIVSDAEDGKDGETKEVVDDHVGRDMEGHGEGRVLNHRGYEEEEGKTELVRERPDRCGGDELGKGRREEFWVRTMGLCWDKGERDE